MNCMAQIKHFNFKHPLCVWVGNFAPTPNRYTVLPNAVLTINPSSSLKWHKVKHKSQAASLLRYPLGSISKNKWNPFGSHHLHPILKIEIIHVENTINLYWWYRRWIHLTTFNLKLTKWRCKKILLLLGRRRGCHNTRDFIEVNVLLIT